MGRRKKTGELSKSRKGSKGSAQPKGPRMPPPPVSLPQAAPWRDGLGPISLLLPLLDVATGVTAQIEAIGVAVNNSAGADGTVEQRHALLRLVLRLLCAPGASTLRGAVQKAIRALLDTGDGQLLQVTGEEAKSLLLTLLGSPPGAPTSSNISNGDGSMDTEAAAKCAQQLG